MKIEYWNDSDLCDLLYQSGFKQITYLNTSLSEPSYTLEYISVTDQEDDVAIFQRWVKRYGFHVVVPEYYLDALYTIVLHDNVLIEGNVVRDISIEHSFNGRFAICRVEFTSVHYVKSRCENMMLAPVNTPTPAGECYEPNIEIRGIVDSLDFGVPDGTYLLRNDSGYGYVIGEIYYFDLGAYSLLDIAGGEGVIDLSTGISYYYDNNIFFQYPYLSAIDTIEGGYFVHGFGFPETFIYIYYDGILAIDPIPASYFNENGIEIPLTWGDYNWTIESKTFSCDYGTTEEVLYETGFILLNDFGEFITVNEDGSRIYR
jgi:hypothetical protein